jgi:hypothetical protein
MFRFVLLVTAFILVGSPWSDAYGQRTPRVRRSQPATVSQTVGAATITIRYNRPIARGRELFGNLVPYGKVWCPCADEASNIELSHDVTFAGQPVTAGKYTIWTIPTADEWTVILSKAADAFHTPYPEGQDALRVQVKPKSGPHMEALAYYFPVADSTAATLALHWGQTIVEIPIVLAGRSGPTPPPEPAIVPTVPPPPLRN